MKQLIIIFLIFGILYLNADELSAKKEELQRLNAELQELENKLAKTESEKAEKQALKKEIEASIGSIEKKIDKLERNQQQAKKEWDKTKERLNLTSQNLNNLKQNEEQLYGSAHELTRALVISHYSGIVFQSADPFLLANTLEVAGGKLKELNADISDLEDTRLNLEKKEKRDEKYFLDTQWTKIVNKKKRNKIANSLQEVNEEVTALDKELEIAKSRKAQLEAAQEDLNNIIANLQQAQTPGAPSYSYKFSYDKLIWPIKGKLIRKFGSYPGYNKRVSLLSNGIDIAAPTGTDVHCVDKGIVVYSNSHGGNGRLIVVDHQNGFYSIYGHNSELLVNKNDIVERGTIIAKTGQSGLAEQPCLHFEIRKDAIAVDPLDYLQNKE